MAGMATVSIPQELPLGVVGGGWKAADLELLPDDGRRYEIIDGVLVVSPAPTPRHQWVSRGIQRILEDRCGDRYRVFNAPLDWTPADGTVVQPDLLVVPRGSLDAPVRSPVLLVEVLSPSSVTMDRDTKFHRYERADVPQYWIVDPGLAGASGEPREPSIEIYDLAETGGYELQVRAVGDEPVTVVGPVSVTVIPAELIA